MVVATVVQAQRLVEFPGLWGQAAESFKGWVCPTARRPSAKAIRESEDLPAWLNADRLFMSLSKRGFSAAMFDWRSEHAASGPWLPRRRRVVSPLILVLRRVMPPAVARSRATAWRELFRGDAAPFPMRRSSAPSTATYKTSYDKYLLRLLAEHLPEGDWWRRNDSGPQWILSTWWRIPSLKASKGPIWSSRWRLNRTVADWLL